MDNRKPEKKDNAEKEKKAETKEPKKVLSPKALKILGSESKSPKADKILGSTTLTKADKILGRLGSVIKPKFDKKKAEIKQELSKESSKKRKITRSRSEGDIQALLKDKEFIALRSLVKDKTTQDNKPAPKVPLTLKAHSRVGSRADVPAIALTKVSATPRAKAPTRPRANATDQRNALFEDKVTHERKPSMRPRAFSAHHLAKKIAPPTPILTAETFEDFSVPFNYAGIEVHLHYFGKMLQNIYRALENFSKAKDCSENFIFLYIILELLAKKEITEKEYDLVFASFINSKPVERDDENKSSEPILIFNKAVSSFEGAKFKIRFASGVEEEIQEKQINLSHKSKNVLLEDFTLKFNQIIGVARLQNNEQEDKVKSTETEEKLRGALGFFKLAVECIGDGLARDLMSHINAKQFENNKKEIIDAYEDYLTTKYKQWTKQKFHDFSQAAITIVNEYVSKNTSFFSFYQKKKPDLVERSLLLMKDIARELQTALEENKEEAKKADLKEDKQEVSDKFPFRFAARIDNVDTHLKKLKIIYFKFTEEIAHISPGNKKVVEEHLKLMQKIQKVIEEVEVTKLGLFQQGSKRLSIYSKKG